MKTNIMMMLMSDTYKHTHPRMYPQNLTKLVLADDRGAIRQRLDTMLSVIDTMEQARKAAGIFFPGD